MSPYSLVSENKRKTWLIMFLFIILFSGFFYLIGKYFNDPAGYLFLGLIISTISSIGSYFYSDKIVLFTVGAKPASKREFFDFYTVTENLTIASGLPMPKLYVIDDPSPNAFATGRDPNHAVVCATTGLLKMMDRSDIEGVVAHELSHIKNYDILLASIVSVLVGAISIIADWIMRSLWWRGRDDDERKNPAMGLILVLALIITPIVATLIQLAISRKREFLADASAVLITRNPKGLADALEKISRYQTNKFIPTSMAHLFIVSPLNANNSLDWLTNLFSTHPPIKQRIKLLREME
ncbi:MAG: zinc metalloprotease HtpX [Candidatus Microgenomates bacterium]